MERRIGVWLTDTQLVAVETTDGVVTGLSRCSGEDALGAWAQWSRTRRRKAPITVALDLADQRYRMLTVADAPEDVARAQLAERLGTSVVDGDELVCGRAVSGSGAERFERRVAAGAVRASVVAEIRATRAGKQAVFTPAAFVLPADGAYCVLAPGHSWVCVVQGGVPTHTRRLESEGRDALVGRLGGEGVMDEALRGRAGPESLGALDHWLDGLAAELAETARSWQHTLGRSVGPWTLLGASSGPICALVVARLEGQRGSVRRPLSPEHSAGVDRGELAGCSIAAWAAGVELAPLERLCLPAPKDPLADMRSTLVRRRGPIALGASVAAVALGLPLVLGALASAHASSLLAAERAQAVRAARYVALGAYDQAMSSAVEQATGKEPAWSKLVRAAMALAPSGVVVTQASFGESGPFVAAQVQASAPGATPAIVTQWASALRGAGMEGVTVPQVSSAGGGTTFTIGFAERT